MVQSKFTLLALASTALAGVVQREESEVDYLNPDDSHFSHPSAWVTSTHQYSKEEGSISAPFLQKISDNPRDPHSTYIPFGLSPHFPQSTKEVLPPFITSFPGAGEFAHTKDSSNPSSVVPGASHPVPPYASYGGPPSFSVPARPEESQVKSPPPAFQASSSYPPIPSSHAASTRPSYSTNIRSISSVAAATQPARPWSSLDPLAPTSIPENPSWLSHLPPPFESTSGPDGSEKDHYSTPPIFPGAYQSPPPPPFESTAGEPSEPQSSSPVWSHQIPPPGVGYESDSFAGSHQGPPPSKSYQEVPPPPVDSTPREPAKPESSSPVGSSLPPPLPESYHGPPPSDSTPWGPSGEGSKPAGFHQAAPPPKSYQGPPPFDSASGEPQEHPSLPGDAKDFDHLTEPTLPHKGPSPHYGTIPPVSCPLSHSDGAPSELIGPHNIADDKPSTYSGDTNLPPFRPPLNGNKQPHGYESTPSQAVTTPWKTSATHSEGYVPHFSKPVSPFTSHADIPSTMPSTYPDRSSKSPIPSPTNSKPQPQGTIGEHHAYGSPPSVHPPEPTDVTGRPTAFKSAPEPSKTAVPKGEESNIHYSGSVPASSVPIISLLAAFGTVALFCL